MINVAPPGSETRGLATGRITTHTGGTLGVKIKANQPSNKELEQALLFLKEHNKIIDSVSEIFEDLGFIHIYFPNINRKNAEPGGSPPTLKLNNDNNK